MLNGQQLRLMHAHSHNASLERFGHSPENLGRAKDRTLL